MTLLPNIITLFRIAGSLSLLLCDVANDSFWIIYALCGISDIADGWLARKLKCVTKTGALLDSLADICFVACLCPLLLPILELPQWLWLWAGVIVVIKVVNQLSGLMMYGHCNFPHTAANKATGFLLFIAVKHHVEVVSVHDYKVNPCLGCNACFMSKDNTCAQKDDMPIIYDKMAHADMLVVASPEYFYALSAQLKAVIDRCHNPVRDSFPIKKMALLLVGAATLPELFDSILAQYQLCLNFFKLEDAGRVLVRGVKDKGDIKNTNALNEAFELGQSI